MPPWIACCKRLDSKKMSSLERVPLDRWTNVWCKDSIRKWWASIIDHAAGIHCSKWINSDDPGSWAWDIHLYEAWQIYIALTCNAHRFNLKHQKEATYSSLIPWLLHLFDQSSSFNPFISTWLWGACLWLKLEWVSRRKKKNSIENLIRAADFIWTDLNQEALIFVPWNIW